MPIEVASQSLNQKAREAIRVEMARRQVSQDALTKAIGRSQKWLSDRLTGRVPLSLSDIENIARALIVPIETLLDLPSVPRQRRAS